MIYSPSSTENNLTGARQKSFLLTLFNIAFLMVALGAGCLGILFLLLSLITELVVEPHLYLWGIALLVAGGVIFFVISLFNRIAIKRILIGYLLGVMGTLGLLISCCGLIFSIEALCYELGRFDGLIIICLIIGAILSLSMWLLFVAVYVRHKSYLDVDKQVE